MAPGRSADISGFPPADGRPGAGAEEVGVLPLEVGVDGFSICSLVLRDGVERADEDPECEGGRSRSNLTLDDPPAPK